VGLGTGTTLLWALGGGVGAFSDGERRRMDAEHTLATMLGEGIERRVRRRPRGAGTKESREGREDGRRGGREAR